MKNLNIILLLVAVGFLPSVGLTGTMTLLPGAMMPPAPYQSIETHGVNRTIVQPAHVGWGCTFDLFIVDQPNEVIHRYTLHDNSAPYKTCFGASTRVGNYREIMDNIIVNLNSYKIPFVKTTLASYKDTPPYCAAGVTLTQRNGVTAHSDWVMSECDASYAPNPVSCDVRVPDVMAHGSNELGRIRSKIKQDLIVSCSATTTVSVSIGSARLPLTGDKNTIDSSLYLGAEGKTSVNVHATPHGTTKLISVIDAVATVPGAYLGNIVITASWP